MKDTVPIPLQCVMPSSKNLALSYLLALIFISMALFLSYGTIESPGAFLWLIGAGWLGRATEKTSLKWKISRLKHLSDAGEDD